MIVLSRRHGINRKTVASLNRRVMATRLSLAVFAPVMRQLMPGKTASGGTHQQSARPSDDGATKQTPTDRAHDCAGGLVEAQAVAVAVARIAVMIHAVVMLPGCNRASQAQRHEGDGQCPWATR